MYCSGKQLKKMEADEIIFPGMLSVLGIRSMKFENAAIAACSASEYKDTEKKPGTQDGWRLFKQYYPLNSVWRLFDKFSVILFADWASLACGTDIWDGLLSEVIKPLGEKGHAFIFQLGDITPKKAFEVDEILCIISDFSSHGSVSLVLDKQEADSLYQLLHGMRGLTWNQQLQKNCNNQYASIFQSLHIDQLMICMTDSIMVYQKNRQFELAGNNGDGKETALHAALNWRTLQ